MKKYQYSPETRSVLESLQQPLAVFQYIDGHVVTLVVSDGFCRLFGYADRRQAMSGMDHDMFGYTHPDDRAQLSESTRRFAEKDEPFDVVYRTRAGVASDYRVVHARAKHVFPEKDVRLAHVWYMDEGMYVEGEESAGTQMNRTLNSVLHEKSILRATRYDGLTGLPNLAWFFKLCEMAKNRMLRKGRQSVLLYMDLSGMKYFNHRFGFAQGDQLLKAFADVLVRVFGRDNSCHIGADRFAACWTEDGSEEKIRLLFRETEKSNGGKTLPVRVGVYSTGVEDVPVSSAYDRAKLACDAIHPSGSSAYNRYAPEMSKTVRRHQYIIANFDRALAEKWVQVYYQPIVRAVSQKVCDEEALARWIDPAEGLLPPAEFIPHLENAGLIYRLDLYVLEQVLERILARKAAGKEIVPHSINLSRSDFETCDIVEEIRKRVDEAGVPRNLVTIEITESIIGSDFEYMKKQITRFRELGFPVWMDDFGSGYSSLDVLQSVRFDLIKFDMSFLRKLDEGESGKIILTEMMKMATSLGLDTVCEGVEKESQVRFLQEIGCSKLQGYYFCRPISNEQVEERYRKGRQIGFENPEASAYFETIGRADLYDLSAVAGQDEGSFQNAFNTLPMGIIEIRGDTARFIRSNPSYRDFIRRFFSMDLSYASQEFVPYFAEFMKKAVKVCCDHGSRSFFAEKMWDGSVAHTLTRRIAVNPVNGDVALAVAVLSVSDPGEGESFADIARALAEDYYNIYVVDLDTDRFIEYSSPVGEDILSVRRHGSSFFESARTETMTRIYEEDRGMFLKVFTRENILRELDGAGAFTFTYRLMESVTPVYVNMKVTRMKGTNRIILGVSNIDSQMKQLAQVRWAMREKNALARVMALTENYLILYSVDTETGNYVEYTISPELESLGLAKEGTEFFRGAREGGRNLVYPEDIPLYLREFTRENILKEIRKKGQFLLDYRMVLHGRTLNVTLKVTPYQSSGNEKLLAGVRVRRTET